MKRTLLFIAFVLTSLTMSAQDGLTVGDIQNSGCLNKTQEEKIPTIVLTKEGSVLSVQLLNYESYTATTDFNVTSYISNDDPCTVTINVTPIIPEGAQVEWEWVCLFNVSFTIRDFEPNRFYLNCWWCKGLIELKDGEPMILEKKVENVTIDGISFSLLKASHKAMLVDWTTTEEDLHIPSKVTYENEDYTVTCISKDAFWNANQATKVTVPKTVRSMNLFSDNALYANPFRECMSLKWIVVEDGCPLFSSMDEVLFAENKTMLLGYPIASPRTTYTVPKGVTKIRSGAFHHNKYLRKLMIREEVTDLGWHLFSDTQSLEELYIRGIIDPACMSDLFGGMDTKVAVYVQQSEVEKYKAVYKGPVSPLPWAQEDSDYLPFVEFNKQWHIVIPYGEPHYGGSISRFWMVGEVERNGKAYAHTQRYLDALCEIQEAGLFREENRRVYKYDETTGRDILMYDFSLKEGDTFTYEFGYDQPVNCKVLKEGWLEDGPDIVSSSTSNPDGTLDIKYRKLHTWTIGRENESGEYEEIATWVECIGALENVFGLIDNGFMKFDNSLAYVQRKYDEEDYRDNGYLPISFYSISMHGCNLPTSETNEEYDDKLHHLTYELEGDRLHIYGDIYTQCGPNNYAYFYEWPAEMYDMPTHDPSVQMIEFLPWEVAPAADCMSHQHTDFYVPGFDPNLNYYVSDNNGEIHPVIKKMAYRPMIEDDKVWKVGTVLSGNPVQLVQYYYFDGDTIINGKICKQMMCQRYVNPDYAKSNNLSPYNSLNYVGAWYEEDKKVYEYDTTGKQFKLMYDFSLEDNGTFQINDLPYVYVVGPRKTGGIKGFKGINRDVLEWADGESYKCAPWLEGVGVIYGPPTTNIFNVELEDPAWFLMSCSVGEEVIYLREGCEDGATPWEMDAKKHRFDFTHTIKTKPQTRSEAAEEKQPLYGEYSDQLLDINLDPLDEAYLVRITNESDKVVYEKTINAGNIVALNIDISAYPEGRYTVTIENNGESFTGEFVTQTTGIEENVKTEIKNTSIYNLQGQRLNTLQRGLNIVNGRKVYVK